MSLLLKNATYIDWETLQFTNSDILVETGIDGKIEFISSHSSKGQFKCDGIIDCSGKLVMKSFAVGHHHAYSALARGMGTPKKNPENFVEILRYIWWNLDKCLDDEMVWYSALVTAMACAKAGSAFIIDHHASPNAIKNSLQIIADAFEKTGVSHLLCYEISDRDGMEKAEKGLEETENYLKKTQGLVGLHASFTLSDETIEQAVELMNKYDSGIHIHVAEDKADQEHCMSNFGKRVVNRLNDLGVLDSSKTILVHCLHLSDEERKIIKNSPVWIAENMDSNLNNRVGFFSSKMLGNRIMLGTDGMHSDMLQSAKSAYLSGLAHDDIDFQSAYSRLRNVHRYIKQNNYSGDGENNLVILNYDSPTELNSSNFFGHFIYGLNSNHIEHVISKGEIIVKNRIIQKIDEVEILQRSRELSMKLWERMGK